MDKGLKPITEVNLNYLSAQEAEELAKQYFEQIIKPVLTSVQSITIKINYLEIIYKECEDKIEGLSSFYFLQLKEMLAHSINHHYLIDELTNNIHIQHKHILPKQSNIPEPNSFRELFFIDSDFENLLAFLTTKKVINKEGGWVGLYQRKSEVWPFLQVLQEKHYIKPLAIPKAGSLFITHFNYKMTPRTLGNESKNHKKYLQNYRILIPSLS